MVVEGYLDVIALHQAGIEEAVAPLGTALTEAQLERLWRLTETPILCFDGDAAGKKAAMRAAARAMPMLVPGKDLRVAVLPEGQDPDDVIRDGGVDALETHLSSAKTLDRTIYDFETSQVNPSSPADRASLRDRLERFSLSCPNRIVSEEYRRSFVGYFFEDFGWKGKYRDRIAQSVVATGPSERIELLRTYRRSVMYGVSRYPQAARSHLELLAHLDVPEDEMKRWQDTLVEATIKRPGLDEDAIAEILDAEQPDPARRFDLQVDLRLDFSSRSRVRGKPCSGYGC